MRYEAVAGVQGGIQAMITSDLHAWRGEIRITDWLVEALGMKKRN
jgi:hypothetical protein